MASYGPEPVYDDGSDDGMEDLMGGAIRLGGRRRTHRKRGVRRGRKRGGRRPPTVRGPVPPRRRRGARAAPAVAAALPAIAHVIAAAAPAAAAAAVRPARPRRRRFVSRKKMVRGKALKQILAHLGHIRKRAHKLHRGRGRRLGGAMRGYEYNANS